MKMGKTVEDMDLGSLRADGFDGFQSVSCIFILCSNTFFYVLLYLVLVNKVLNCQIYVFGLKRYILFKRRGNSGGSWRRDAKFHPSEIHGARSHPSQNQVPRGQRCFFFWLVVYPYTIYPSTAC